MTTEASDTHWVPIKTMTQPVPLLDLVAPHTAVQNWM